MESWVFLKIMRRNVYASYKCKSMCDLQIEISYFLGRNHVWIDFCRIYAIKHVFWKNIKTLIFVQKRQKAYKGKSLVDKYSEQWHLILRFHYLHACILCPLIKIQFSAHLHFTNQTIFTQWNKNASLSGHLLQKRFFVIIFRNLNFKLFSQEISIPNFG